MKILFIISCVLLYLILGRLYVELIFLQNVGNPKDYNDLYHGLKVLLRIDGCKAIDDKEWINCEKEYGKSWVVIWVEIAVCLWSLIFIVIILVDMKSTLMQLINFLK